MDEDLTSWVDESSPLPTSTPAGESPQPAARHRRADRGGDGVPAGGIRTGDIVVEGQNAVGPGATAIGSIGRDATFRTGTER
ncbi:hypothetical protein GCM10029963_18890 [Micromonospora andamanensis]